MSVHSKHYFEKLCQSLCCIAVGQRALSISTQSLACNLTNRRIDIQERSLEYSGVINTKVE